MARIKAVLYDYDGTIMDTNQIIIDSWQHVFKTVYGKERTVEEILATFGEPVEDTMRRLVPDLSVEEGLAIYRAYHYGRYEDSIGLFPGAREMMRDVKEAGYKTALVTSRQSNTAWRGIDTFALREYFDEVVTCNDTDKHKPDPEPALIACGKLGVRPEECAMIGDTKYDIGCANNAGAVSVLARWSPTMSEKDRKGIFVPDYEIKEPAEFVKLLEEINARS
jgi:pyrophosphatase PpaX